MHILNVCRSARLLLFFLYSIVFCYRFLYEFTSFFLPRKAQEYGLGYGLPRIVIWFWLGINFLGICISNVCKQKQSKSNWPFRDIEELVPENIFDSLQLYYLRDRILKYPFSADSCYRSNILLTECFLGPMDFWAKVRRFIRFLCLQCFRYTGCFQKSFLDLKSFPT